LVVEGPEQVGGSGKVLQRQLKEQLFARFPLREFLADTGVVRGAVLDGVVEDRRI
jgi:hypothetical protein